MWVLIITLIAFGLLIYLLTFFNRKNKNEEQEIVVENNPEGCCGAHEVCETDSLLTSSDKIEYFDDEELDKLSGIEAEKLTDQQQNQIADVFYTLKENEVASWLKSMQLRNIQLPIAIRDEALLIVSERRGM